MAKLGPQYKSAINKGTIAELWVSNDASTAYRTTKGTNWILKKY